MTFFILGSSFTGWLIGKEKLTLGQSYGRLMCCTGTVVFIAMCAGEPLSKIHYTVVTCERVHITSVVTYTAAVSTMRLSKRCTVAVSKRDNCIQACIAQTALVLQPALLLP
jgi:hypothetical protein